MANEHDLVPCQEQHSMLTPGEESLHNNFTTSVKALRKDLVRTAYYLLQIQEHRIHKKLGFSNLGEYAAEYAGLTARQAREFVEIGRKLPRFPEVEAALQEGRLSWSQARLITRRADPEQQRYWVEQAQSLSAQSLAEVLPTVSGRQPVTTPPAGRQEEAKPGPLFSSASKPRVAEQAAPGRRQYFTLAFSPEQYVRFSGLLAAAKGGSKEEKILNALGAHGGQGASALPYLIVLLHCPACGEAAMPTNRGEMPVPQAMLEAAYCDATVEGADAQRRRTIPPRLRRLALQRARYCCEAEGCSHTQFLEIHHRRPAAAGGGDTLDNLVVLCSGCHRRLHADENAARAALRQVPV